MNAGATLAGRRAIVTGSSRGIGAAVCRELATHGASVVINTHDPAAMDEARELAASIDHDTGRRAAHVIRADVALEDEAEGLVAQGTRWLGGLDILVNNAGVETTAAALDLELAAWDRVMAVNLRGAFVCARAAARLMSAAGSAGVIVSTSSIHERVPRLGLAHYAVSKAGLGMLTRALALEWAEHGIRVLGVSPGAIETESNRREIADFGRDRFEEWIPLSRLGKPEDVARTIRFLASDEASYITGTTIEIDGGYTLNVVRYDPRKPEGKT